jgi:hypothetical protein
MPRSAPHRLRRSKSGAYGPRVSRRGESNVRFGSKTDIRAVHHHVRFTPKADIAERDWDVRFVPKADIAVVGSLNEKPRRSS